MNPIGRLSFLTAVGDVGRAGRVAVWRVLAIAVPIVARCGSAGWRPGARSALGLPEGAGAA